MAIGHRRLFGTIVAVLIFVLGCGAVAGAAIQRTSGLDRRVDAISSSALMTEPATALVDPARQTAALRRVDWTLPGWVLMQLFEAVALFYLWSSGLAATLRDWLARRLRSRWSVRFAFGAALALVARIAGILPSFYLYRVDRVMGLSVELTRIWALYWMGHTVLAMIVAGLVASIVLWLVERTHQWYIYTILATLAATVGWSYIRWHFEPTILPHGTAAEMAYYSAYDLAMRAHAVSIALIEGGIVIVFSALAVVIADRIGFRRDDDPLSRLTIVGALLAIVYLVAVPVRNTALRSYDFDADRYAVATTGDPAEAVRALVRQSDQQMLEVCPDVLAAFFLDRQPGIGARVAAINHVPDACHR